MDKIKEYIKKRQYIDILIIIFLISLFNLLFSAHFNFIFQDKGRELFIPEQMLNGAVPYKDIVLIYFPLAYYINAFIYSIAGVSIDSLLTSQFIFCTIFLIAYYFLANNFLNRATSLLLTIIIITNCIFNPCDCFGYEIPYSFARMYGVFGAFGCVCCIIQLFKQKKLKYAYLASLFAGFSVSCKLEFLTTLLILLIGLFLYGKQDNKEYLKIFLSFLIFPIITILLLFIQGVTINDLISSIVFACKFANTDAMTGFLSKAGLYPYDVQEKLFIMATGFRNIVNIIVLCILGLKLYKKFPRFYILPLLMLLIITYYVHYIEVISSLIPYIILFFCVFNFKNLKEDKITLFLILSSLLMCQREFFKFIMNTYGAYTLPILFLSFCTIIDRYLPKSFLEIKTKQIMNFVLVIILCANIVNLNNKKFETQYAISTSKGTFYTDYNKSMLLNLALNYIEDNTKESDTILVLPEGNIINFLANRKVDLKCFMMDRLYHDAYGEEEAKNKIKNSNSNYIILLEHLNLNDFGKNYLYTEDETQCYKYIFDNYDCIKIYRNGNSKISILRKKRILNITD